MKPQPTDKLLIALLGAVPLVTVTCAAILAYWHRDLPAAAWGLAGGCIPALLSPPGRQQHPGDTIGATAPEKDIPS